MTAEVVRASWARCGRDAVRGSGSATAGQGRGTTAESGAEPDRPTSAFPAHGLAPPVDAEPGDARLVSVEVVLRKLGKGSRAVAGRLVRAPRKGSVVVIEFPDGMHEYVTTPVKRVLRLAGREVFYIETINSRYRLEVRSREDAVAESAG
ncbi:MAG: hypothetical protein JWO86_7287 [Myxococcaceae bacterium]|nr:hypothetical protein [Myxococcaceae bacterium]